VLTLAINTIAQKEEAAMKMLLVLGVCNPQSIACGVWYLRFQDKAKISDNLSLSLRDIVYVFTYMSLYV
jgi:hypothetical protein